MQTTPSQSKPHKNIRRTEPQWRELITQWQQGDLSIAKFCEKHNLSNQSFYAWKNKLSKSTEAIAPAPPVFIDLSQDASISSSSWNIVLKLDSGMELQLTRH